jgi:uracil-DNA glycosylase
MENTAMNLPREWHELLSPKAKLKLGDIERQVAAIEAEGVIVYPPIADRYKAFKLNPSEIQVVIVGQDPYHDSGQAMGLSFSVPKGIKVPPSLKNIYKELNDDYPGIFNELPKHGDLRAWAEQGVLLLNTALSVEAGKPGSHKHLGWKQVTSEIVHQLSHRYPNIPFILWGSHAKDLKRFVNPNSFIVESTHPSPLRGACYKGFFGSRPFSRINAHLANVGMDAIDWSVDG